MSKGTINIIKKIAVSLVAVLLVFVRTPYIVLAIEMPSAPAKPSVPEEPDTPDEPSSPDTPDEPDSPDLPEQLKPPEPSPEDSTGESREGREEEPESSSNDSGDSSNNSESTDEGSSQEGSGNQLPTDSTGSSESQQTGGESTDRQVGDPKIETGDATTSAGVSTIGNDNFSSASPANGDTSGGASVVNDGNGSGSENTGSVTIDSDDTTIQANEAAVVNNLEAESETGDNSASRNVGSSTIETGDANTTGTLVTAVNTNVDGVMVNEFNVADDHLGDIILDFDSGCISGCLDEEVSAENTGNGSGSVNDAQVETAVDTFTFQQNDASVENNMVLDSDSGGNDADRNTGGDSTIITGDANVSANALTFANNNLAGNVIYSVVNIFGDLVGDIIFPDGGCCFDSVTAQNTGNGADSINIAELNLSDSDMAFQFNAADIQNDLIIYANTGDNETSRNTGGDNSIKTGEAKVEAEVINVANTNIAGGDWWLVIVNEAGNWIGRILGSPEGALFAGSAGFDISENASGEIIVSNAGNGSGSQNNGTVSSEVDNTTVQVNNANVVNNLDLSANTGGNSASRNTGGNNSITTGDANVIANIVNFVNNNIVGGRLFVNVVNVFGSWLGDFISPGYEKEEENLADSSGGNSIGGAGNESSNSSAGSSSSLSSGEESENAEDDELTPTPYFETGALLASAVIEGEGTGSQGSNDVIGFSSGEGVNTETAGEQVVSINLAWLILLIPAYLVVTLIRKRKRLLKLLPAKGE